MKQIDIRDFTNYHYPTIFTPAPDGKHAVMAVVDASEKDNCYESCLWLYDMETKKTSRLTSGKKERTFIWMDSETVLFIADREKTYQEKAKNEEDWTCFYTLNIHGGEAQFAFAVPYKAVKMKKAGNKLVLTVKYDYNKPDLSHMEEGEEKKAALKAWKEEKDYEVFDELPFWANGQGIVNKKRLAVYDPENGSCEIVTPDYENVENSWIEGDNTILYVSSLYTDKKDVYQGLKQYTISTGELKTLVEQKDMSIDYACILKGKVTFFGSYMKEYGFNENDKLYTVEDGKVELLSDYDDSIHNSICCDCKFADGASAIHDEDKIYFIATLRKQSVIRTFDAKGHMETILDRQGSVHTLAKSGNTVYFTGMRDMGLTECYAFDGNGETKLTSFNDAVMAERSVCPVEEFTFTYKDLELDGYVIKPVNFDPNKTYPGILTIHGGPRATFGPTFFHESEVFANAGYFVFFTNPLGSDGRGNEFADITGKHGGIDFECCMAVTDEVLKRYPQVDEKHLGVMGGSYGGFMAKTPTLFIQSDEDYRCWMGDAIQMFSALKYFGVEARMCLFHGENHELSRSGKPKHRIRRMTEMMEWFEKYLK